MKKLLLLTLSAILVNFGSFAEGNATDRQVFQIETGKSKVFWTGKKVTGQHTGTISLMGGEVVAVSGSVASALVKIDMNSIVCTDLTDPEWNQKLVGHLKSDDFFSVQKFPESVFRIQRVEKMNSNGGEYNCKVAGTLTIKGITHEIEFPARVDMDESLLKASGKATVDRAKYDVKYGSGSFFQGLGDNLIYDDFEIVFELVASAGQAN